MSKEIKNIEDLYKFILDNDLTPDETRELLQTTLRIWISGEYEKETLVDMLRAFLNKYPVRDETRPLFLDVDIDKVKLTDFGYKSLIKKEVKS